MKDYTFTIKTKRADGTVLFRNETDTAKGYRKSWYKTEESARAGLWKELRFAAFCGETILEWTLYGRYHDIGIIEKYPV